MVLRLIRLPALMMLAAIVPAILAACGGSSPSGRGATVSSGVRYADCMRSHGVSGFPDQLPGGGLAPGPNIDTQSPVFISAQKDCAGLEPAATHPHKTTEEQKRLAVTFSRCIRAHGLPKFPDPSLTLPPPGQFDGGIIRAGLYWPLPNRTTVSPGFRRAAVACGWKIAPEATAG
jgi:hypothetical protein